MKLSVVIPFFDEETNVGPVLRELRRIHPEAEIIAVDDGSGDGTYEVLSALRDEAGLVVHRLPRHLGQSAAIYAGLCRAQGDYVVLMDGDGQSDPSDIKRLLAELPAHDLVNGRREVRSDTAARRVASRVANAVRAGWLRDGMRDTCGTPKAMKRECVEHLVPFDGMHRYIPAQLAAAGFGCQQLRLHQRDLIKRCCEAFLRSQSLGGTLIAFIRQCVQA